jgi:CBS domain-containing protein
VSDALQQDLTELALDTRVGQLIRKDPLSCLPGTSLKQAFEAMDAAKAGSMLVCDASGAVQGILTRYDLISRVILPRLPLSTPIQEVMSTGVKTIDADSGALEAMLMMARHRVRHLPVLQHGFLVGLISEGDLVSFQRSSLRILSASIEQAESLGALKLCSQEVLRLARRLLAQGVAATSLARLVSHLNDSLTRRVIQLTEAQMRDQLGPLPPWAWLALGSEGREEQTVATDQDNAIIFEADGPAFRSRFMKLAAAINQGLADVGFPLCKGGVMAMNEKWCKSVTEWRDSLSAWMRSPQPEALLDANIFLDFRGLYGEVQLADTLRKWLSDQVESHQLFLRSLAQDAMRDGVESLTRNGVRVSLARALRKRGYRAHWLAPAQLEMKRGATAPVVYFARVLALAKGISQTSTDERLQALVERQSMSASESQQMRDAFNVLQRYRLRAQLEYASRAERDAQAEVSPNVLQLDSLNSHEIERLSEALSHLGGLRARLEMDFLR